MAGKGTRHRFELSRLEMAGVVVSATAGLFVVFLLGIYAGRGMADRRADVGEQIVRLPVAPAVEQTPGAEDGLTFYDTLGQADRKAGGHGEKRVATAPLDDAPIAAAPEAHQPPKAPAAKPIDSDIAGKVEKPAKQEVGTKPEAAPKPEVATKPEAPSKVVKEEPLPAAAPSPAAVAKVEKAPAPPSTARVAVALAPAAAATPRAPTKGDWSVQVSATRDPRQADGVLKRLRAKGYDAFVLKVRRRGETFYRVRVGHYESLEQAQQIVTRLRREPGVPEAFVASD